MDIGGDFIPLQNLRRRGWNPLREIALLRELVSIYRREQVVCALHFTIKPVIYGSLAARWAGAGNISTLTGLGYTFLAGKKTSLVATELYRLALRRAGYVFFHNPDDRALFLRRGLCRPDQSHVVGGSGIRLADFPRAALSAANPDRVLFAGRLLTDKGIREYVAAARLARKVVPELHFHVLGPIDQGNPAAITESELEDWIASGDIVYDGVTEDIRSHLQRASCVVLPSYREGCPRVLLEAAASGRPLVGTDVPGVREVVIDGENGFLVPVKSTDALAAAVMAIHRLPEARVEQMADKGRKLVEAKFSEQQVVSIYLKAVASLVK